jgi:hypothetical protein
MHIGVWWRFSAPCKKMRTPCKEMICFCPNQLLNAQRVKKRRRRRGNRHFRSCPIMVKLPLECMCRQLLGPLCKKHVSKRKQHSIPQQRKRAQRLCSHNKRMRNPHSNISHSYGSSMLWLIHQCIYTSHFWARYLIPIAYSRHPNRPMRGGPRMPKRRRATIA